MRAQAPFKVATEQVRQWVLSVPTRPRYFMQRDGAVLSLNGHVHFHVCVVDGVFEAAAREGEADAAYRTSSPGVVLHPTSAIDAPAVARMQADLCRRILRALVGYEYTAIQLIACIHTKTAHTACSIQLRADRPTRCAKTRDSADALA